MTNPNSGLLSAMAEHGLDPGTIVWDGELHRFRGPEDRKGEKDGWYRTYPDPPEGAVFGYWKTGLKAKWWNKNGRPENFDLAAHRAIWAQREKKREKEQAEIWGKTAATCRVRLEGAKPASKDHPYLVAKGVTGETGLLEEDGHLLVPMKGCEKGNPVWSIQTISPGGDKRFAKGGKVRGAHYQITTGGFNGKGTVYVAEGWATGRSIHQVTGDPVFVAFFASNLQPVAEYIRKQHPEADLIIAADNDRWSKTEKGENPGIIYALEAAAVSGAIVKVPQFASLEGKPTDFNDLHRLEGVAAVQRCLDGPPLMAQEQTGGPRPLHSEDRTAPPSGEAAGLDGWAPEPDEPRLPEPDLLPVDAFPAAIRRHVESVSAALQVPPDLPVTLALSVLSACLAGRLEVEVRPGWREPVGIYTAVILPPASRKSPAFAAMTAPLREWEEARITRAAPLVAAALDAVDVAERNLETKKAGVVKNKASLDEVEMARMEVEEARSRIPPDGRLLAGDITPEALVIRMEKQGGRVALLEPEPGPLQLLAGRYSDRARLDELKKAWSGEALLVDRVGRSPIRVPRPALTLGLCLQPGVLEGLQNAKAFRVEGVLGRFLWCQPNHGLGKRLTGPDVPSLDEKARAEFERTVLTLLEAGPAESGKAEPTDPWVLGLDSRAVSVLHDFEAEVEDDLADGGRFESIRDWGGKAVGHAVRLAALLEMAARAGDCRPLFQDPIGPWAMENGVRIVRALASHALAVLGGMGMNEHTALLQYVLRRACDLPEEDKSLRDLYEKTKGRSEIESMEDLSAFVESLIERGCIRLCEINRKGPGRPPSPKIEIHPALATSVRTIRTTHGIGGEMVDSANSANGNGNGGPEHALDPERGEGSLRGHEIGDGKNPDIAVGEVPGLLDGLARGEEG